jgi:hypothetical protein
LIFVDSEPIFCLQSKIALRSYDLHAIHDCSWNKHVTETEPLNIVTILLGKHDRKLTLQSDSANDLICWICAIDSIQIYKQYAQSIINPIDKVSFEIILKNINIKN